MAGAAVPCSLPALRPSSLRTVRLAGSRHRRQACPGPPSRSWRIAPARLRGACREVARVRRGRWPARRSLARCRSFGRHRFARSALPDHGVADRLAPARRCGPGASPRLACVERAERSPAWGEGSGRRGGPLLAAGLSAVIASHGPPAPDHGIADRLAPARLRGPGASPRLACDAHARSRKEEGEEGKQSFRWRKTC